MAAPRARRIAIVVGTVAVIALVVAGFASQESLRERWHIWRLSSENDEVRFRAADALVEMKSTRGAREMVRLLKEKRFSAIRSITTRPQEKIFLVDPLGYGLFYLGPVALEILHEETDEVARTRSLINMIESRQEGRTEAIAIGSPNWRSRYSTVPFSPLMVPDKKWQRPHAVDLGAP